MFATVCDRIIRGGCDRKLKRSHAFCHVRCLQTEAFEKKITTLRMISEMAKTHDKPMLLSVSIKQSSRQTQAHGKSRQVAAVHEPLS
jgi:hypothetical protein